MTRRERSARGEGAELAVEILDEAERLLLDKGSTGAVSMRRIADRVGVTPPSIYLHFDDKADLFFRVCERRWGDFAEALAKADAEGGDPIERLQRCGRAYVNWGLEHPEHYRLIFGGITGEDLTSGRDLSDSPGTEAFERLVGIVGDGVDEGVFRQVEPVTAATTMWALVHGLTMILMDKSGHDELGLPDQTEMIESVLDHSLQGLLPRPGT